MSPDRGMDKEDAVRCMYTMEYSVQFSCSVMPDSLQPHGLQHTRLPVHQQLTKLAQTHVHRVGNSIQSSHPVIPFSCLHSFPASGSYLMSLFFASGGHSIGASASASVLMNIQDEFPLGLTGLISLQSKGLSRVFSVGKIRILSPGIQVKKLFQGRSD